MFFTHLKFDVFILNYRFALKRILPVNPSFHVPSLLFLEFWEGACNIISRSSLHPFIHLLKVCTVSDLEFRFLKLKDWGLESLQMSLPNKPIVTNKNDNSPRWALFNRSLLHTFILEEHVSPDLRPKVHIRKQSLNFREMFISPFLFIQSL